MSLTINNPVGGAAALPTTTTTTTRLSLLHHRVSLSSRSGATHIVAATGKFTSRTGKFDSKNRRTTTTTTKDERGERKDFKNFDGDEIGNEGFVDSVDDGFVLPKLPGEEPNFWEGPQWDALGFFVQYMWAFGVVFALVACGVAVATYNDGATDFRETPAYKESVQSKDLSEGLEGSDTDVFESNPTEEAPALE